MRSSFHEMQLDRNPPLIRMDNKNGCICTAPQTLILVLFLTVFFGETINAGDDRSAGVCTNDSKKEVLIQHTNLWPEHQLHILTISEHDQGVPEIWSTAHVLVWVNRSAKPNQAVARRIL